MKQGRKGRWLALFLAFAMMWTNLHILSVDSGNVSAAAGDFVMDEDMEGYLKEYNGTDKDVVIPDGVKEIGYEVFKGRNDITSITMPDSVTKIWADAFDGCSGLKNITLSQNLEYIALEAFRGCSSLTEITIPKSTTMLPGGMFEGCDSLVKITVEEGNTEYDSHDNCNAIIEKRNGCLIDGCKTTVIPSDVKIIGANAFKGRRGLSEIVLPAGLTDIGAKAFEDCSDLTEITIPEDVTTIAEYAFKNCAVLTEITIPAKVNRIADGAFHDCSGLTSITVAEGNTVYDSRNGCNAVIETESDRLTAGCSKTVIPEDVKVIGTRAFQGCSNLKSIAIPAGLEDVDGAIFAGCDNLVSITVAEENEILDSRENCNAIIRKEDNMLLAGCGATVIPDGVEIIFEDAFADCTSLTDIVIPESVISIRDYAFAGCSNLKMVMIPREVLEIHNNVFKDCDNLTIYGKKGSLVERYADSRNIPFKEIGSEVPENLGDADGSGDITTDDALAILKYTAGMAPDGFNAVLADCDGADGITTDDALAILEFVAGIVDKFS